MEPEVNHTPTNSFNHYLPLVGVALVLAIVAVGGYLLFANRGNLTLFNQSLVEPRIATYEECVSAVGSELSGINTEICTSAEGMLFYQDSQTDFVPAPLAECPDNWVFETAEETGERGEFIYYGEFKLPIDESKREWITQNCPIRPTGR